MSKLINYGPLITKIARDMLEQEDTILDVDTIYAKLEADHHDVIYESAQQLATRAIKQSIKAHLRTAHSVGGKSDDRQGSFLKDEPATIAVKRAGGGYGYVPLRSASLKDIEAATRSKERNIENVGMSFDRWMKFTMPIVEVMHERQILFGEAQDIADKNKVKPKKKPRSKQTG